MTDANGTLPASEARDVRGGGFLRGLNRILPLGRKYHPLLRALNGRRGLLATPFDRYRLLQPAAWSKAVTSQLLSGVEIASEFQVIKPICRQLTGGVLVDVGANIGAFTLLLRSVSTLPVIAYEPQPFLFKLLQWNIGFNRLTGVDARNVACGSRCGEVAFSLGINGSIVCDGAKTGGKLSSAGPAPFDLEQQAEITQGGDAVVNVPVTTLDEDLADVPPVALLKIDCEGFEYEVLRGAANLIRQHRPWLVLEVHPTQLEEFGHSTKEVLDLVDRDYELDFWYFQIGRHASKLSRSLAKFRRPKAHRCAGVSEMLAAATSTPGPAQIYFIGQPRKES
ncbi:MAG: FkbM family methyltransferase [Verrucomicrobiia bacterium]